MTIKPKYERQPKRIRKRDLAGVPTAAESKAAYDAVTARSGGLCEGTGTEPAAEIHHRLYRSRGGLNTEDNLLALSGHGNFEGAHGKAHTLLGEQLGWSVKRGNDPKVIPYFRLSDQTWRQWDGEKFVPMHAGTAVEVMVAFGQINYGGQR
jgi:hypothetical protein